MQEVYIVRSRSNADMQTTLKQLRKEYNATVLSPHLLGFAVKCDNLTLDKQEEMRTFKLV